MDRVISARIDASTAEQITWLAEQLNTTKKNVLECAIRQYAETVTAEAQTDVFARTQGAWKREEPPDVTVERARRPFRQALERHHR